VQNVFSRLTFWLPRSFSPLAAVDPVGPGDKTPVTVKAKLPGGELVEAEVRPRDVLSEVLLRSDATRRGENPGFKDIATVVEGTKDGKPLTIRVDTTAWPHEAYGVSGGTLVVGVPPAVVARWLAAGEVEAKGGCHRKPARSPALFHRISATPHHTEG
jgi:hypothetical protein